MFLLVKKIGLTLVVLATEYQGMASATFVIKEGKHIDVYLELVFIQMNIVWCDWVRKSVDMVANKHFIREKMLSLTMLFWELMAFEKVEKRVAETALVIDLNVNYAFLLRKKIKERLPAATLERSVIHHLQQKL